MLLPRCFTKLYRQQLQQNALLQDPTRNTLIVNIHGHINRLWFGKSITILRNIYRLHTTTWIKFSYAEPAKFSIKVYESKQKETSYPAQLINNSEAIHQLQKGKHTEKPGVPVNYDTIRYWNELVTSGKHDQLMWKAILSAEQNKGTSRRVCHIVHFIILLIDISLYQS